MERHCFTYHGDETAIIHLATDRSLQEIINIYKYFLYLTGLFNNSPLHETIYNEMMTAMRAGKNLTESVEEAMSQWQHEINEIYYDVTKMDCD